MKSLITALLIFLTISTNATPNNVDTTKTCIYNSQLRAMIIDIENGDHYQRLYNLTELNYKDCMKALQFSESANEDLRSVISTQNNTIDQYKISESAYINIIKKKDADLRKAKMKTLGFSIAGGTICLGLSAVTMWVILK